MRKILLCAILIYSATLSSAQVTNTRLWEISHPSVEHTSYLIGTVHSGFEGLFNINDSIYWALDQSELVALELDNEDFSFSAATSAMSSSREMSYLMLECTLEVLPEYKNANTDTLVERYLKGMKSFSSQDITDEGENARSMVFDDFITAYARYNNKKVEGIETMSDQLKVIFSFNKPQLTDVLKKFFDDKERFSTKMDSDSIVFYAANNQSTEICNSFQVMTSDPVWGSYYKRILDERNVNMTDYVLENYKKGAMTCAVGLGHMCGEMGIISLLKKEGYTARPMNIVRGKGASRAISWESYKTEDFTTVVPAGVDTVIERASYLGLSTMLNAFSKYQKKQKNMYIEPKGAVWFEYSVETSYNDDAIEATESVIEFDKRENNFEESLSDYINGDNTRSNSKKQSVQQIMKDAYTDNGSVTDIEKVVDDMLKETANEVSEREDSKSEEIEEPKKQYASRFVEFWSKVNDGRLTDRGGLYNTPDGNEEDETKIDTLSLGAGYGTYTVTYADDVIMEYVLPDNEEITMRIRGDEEVMKRPELLDYFRKAKAIKKN